MGSSLQRKCPSRGTPPSRRSLLLSKLILAPATSSYLLTAFFTAFMSYRRDSNTDIISVCENLPSNTADKRDSTQDRICRPICKPPEQGLQGEDIEKRKQGATLPDRPLENECFGTLPVRLHQRLGVVIHHADPFAELRFKSVGLQNLR